MWLYEVRDQDGDNPVRLLAANNRSVDLVLDAPGQASFSIDLNDAKATEANLREGRSQLYIYRDDVLFWSGIIMIVDRSLTELRQTAKVMALGWAWQLEKRFVGKTSEVIYTNEDAGDILWDLINTSQSLTGGDLGITKGTIESSINLTIGYNRQKIKGVVDDLIAQAGIDWEVTASKILNVYYPKGTDRSSTIKFKYPGNVTSVRILKDATTIINNVLALGRGNGAEEITSQKSDSGAISTFGLYEDVQSFKDIVSQTPLDNMADYVLRLRKNSRLTVDIQVDGNDDKIDLNDYGLGDTIRIIADHPNFSLDQAFRVFEIHISVDENDKETVRLVVALV